MEHVAKQFTLIDFLGIFVSGAVFVLACNYYITDLTAPCIAFFGNGTVMLAAYFVALSYLCGNILHQMGAALESRIAVEYNVYASMGHWQTLIRKAYQEEFDEAFPDSQEGQIQAGKSVFHYVQRLVRPQRIVLFNAFYTMARTALVLMPVLILITFFCESNPTWKWRLIPAYGGAMAVFYYQWKVFDRKCIQEAYMLLISEYTGKRARAQSAKTGPAGGR